MTGKVARKVAKKMTHRDRPEVYVSYRCKFCGGGTFHVGHAKVKETRFEGALV